VVLLSDFDEADHFYISRLLSGILSAAKSQPCALKIISIGSSYLSSFIEQGDFDGIVVLTELPDSSVYLLMEKKIKFVLAGNDLTGEPIAGITTDTFDAVAQAVTYLHSLGHKKISILGGPSYNKSILAAREAFQHSIEELGLPYDENYFLACPWGEAGGYAAADSLFAAGLNPTAFFAVEDYLAGGVIRAAEKRGLSVPRDISVIGSGNMLPSCNSHVPLTTFDNKIYEIGFKSLELLLKIINGTAKNVCKIRIKPELIIRASCGQLSV